MREYREEAGDIISSTIIDVFKAKDHINLERDTRRDEICF